MQTGSPRGQSTLWQSMVCTIDWQQDVLGAVKIRNALGDQWCGATLVPVLPTQPGEAQNSMEFMAHFCSMLGICLYVWGVAIFPFLYNVS